MYCFGPALAGPCIPTHRWSVPMRQPHSIRFHLTAVFLLFFLLVVVLGLFSIWRLSNFNRLSADVAEVWLPNTRALGDLNNFTSDFRAIEGSNLLSSDPSEIAATERQMAALDRSIAEAERELRAHSAQCRRERSVRPVQGALERLPDLRQSDPGAVARQPQGRGAGDLWRHVARRLRRGERHARPVDRPGRRQRAGRQRSARRRLSAGVLAHSFSAWSSPASWSSRRSSISAAPFRRRCCISPTACAGSPPTTPTSISRKPKGATRSARWRRPPSCFATTPSS